MTLNLLSSQEVNRWRRARLFLFDTIEMLSSQLRAERSRKQPSNDKIKALEQQIAILSDVRYELTPHDQTRLRDVLRGQVTIGDISFCLLVRERRADRLESPPVIPCTKSCATCARTLSACVPQTTEMMGAFSPSYTDIGNP